MNVAEELTAVYTYKKLHNDTTPENTIAQA